MKKVTALLLLLLPVLAIASCNRELGLATKYDNTESSKPYEDSEADDPEEDDGFVYTHIGNLSISQPTALTTPVGAYYGGYWPDGKLSPVKNGTTWQMFWCEAVDVLTESTTPWPEDHFKYVKQENAVFGIGFSSIEGFNEDGSWFTGIFQLDNKGHYIGFFHAESHWKGDSEGRAHKSIGVAYSDDYGKTWRDAAPIIVDKDPKPESPDWSGLGDGCVLRDTYNNRWICYYQARVWSADGKSYSNKLCMAASSDLYGASGTWKKWDGKDFTIDAYDPETGLGGKNVAIASLSGVPGSNPSIMWSTYLNRVMMVYASWTKRIFITYSDDGLTWTEPVEILGSTNDPAWYPNLISEYGELTGGRNIRLYYSYQQSNTTGIRKVGCCRIKFD